MKIRSSKACCMVMEMVRGKGEGTGREREGREKRREG